MEDKHCHSQLILVDGSLASWQVRRLRLEARMVQLANCAFAEISPIVQDDPCVGQKPQHILRPQARSGCRNPGCRTCAQITTSDFCIAHMQNAGPCRQPRFQEEDGRSPQSVVLES